MIRQNLSFFNYFILGDVFLSNLYIAQIKQKHGIIERENYNKPKSEKGGQPECPKEKEIAIEEALKYFQMIPSES